MLYELFPFFFFVCLFFQVATALLVTDLTPTLWIPRYRQTMFDDPPACIQVAFN